MKKTRDETNIDAVEVGEIIEIDFWDGELALTTIGNLKANEADYVVMGNTHLIPKEKIMAWRKLQEREL